MHWIYDRVFALLPLLTGGCVPFQAMTIAGSESTVIAVRFNQLATLVDSTKSGSVEPRLCSTAPDAS